MLEESIVTHAFSYLLSHNKTVSSDMPSFKITDIVEVSGRLMNLFRSEFILVKDQTNE